MESTKMNPSVKELSPSNEVEAAFLMMMSNPTATNISQLVTLSREAVVGAVGGGAADNTEMLSASNDSELDRESKAKPTAMLHSPKSRCAPSARSGDTGIPKTASKIKDLNAEAAPFIPAQLKALYEQHVQVSMREILRKHEVSLCSNNCGTITVADLCFLRWMTSKTC